MGSCATMVLIPCCWCLGLCAFRAPGAMTVGYFTQPAGSTMLERSGVRGQVILQPLVLGVGGGGGLGVERNADNPTP